MGKRIFLTNSWNILDPTPYSETVQRALISMLHILEMEGIDLTEVSVSFETNQKKLDVQGTFTVTIL